MLNRKEQPAFKNLENIHFPQEERINLSNGIPVYKLNGGTQDVVKIDLMVHAGALYADTRLQAPLTSLMLNEGTESRSAHEIAEAFDFYGAHFHPKTEKDFAFADLVSLNKHLAQTLPVFTDVVAHSVFPEKAFGVVLQRRKQNYLVDREKTAFLARETFAENLFGASHPYGQAASEQQFDSIQREDLLAFYERKYHAGNFAVVISGKVGDQELKLLDENLGQLPVMLGINKTNLQLETRPGTYTVEKKDAVQTSLRLGFTTVNKYHYQYPGLKVLTTLLGGYFGSRLMKNIREEKGYTYGVHALLVSLQETGYVGIGADVKKEFADEALQEVLFEIDRLKQEPVSTEELQLVKNYMMGELLQMFDGPFAASDSYINALQFGYNFSYYERLMDTILTITPKEIMDLAHTYFKPETFVVVKAG